MNWIKVHWIVFRYATHQMGYLSLTPTQGRRAVIGVLCLVLGGFSPQQARGLNVGDSIQIHGFLTQGYFFTSDNRLFGTSDTGGSFDYTEAGLTGSWTPASDLRLASQVLFRRAGVGHENDVELDFGLLDYTVLSTPDYRLGLRLGRVKIPFGLYNDTRDVLFTRPTILLPQSIYADAQRDLSLSADGGLLYGEYRNDWGNLSFELGVGIPRSTSVDTELGILGFNYPGRTDPNRSYIGRLSYDLQGGKYRLSVSSARVDTRYDPSSEPGDLLAGRDLFSPVIFSAQYNLEKLSLTAEYALRPVKDKGFGEEFDREIIGESYYLQGEYRFDEKWQATLRYDVFYNDREDRHGKKFATKGLYPSHTQFAKDWTFGIRYHLNSSFLIATEYHYIDGTAWIVPLQDNADRQGLERRWHLFAVVAGFRF